VNVTIDVRSEESSAMMNRNWTNAKQRL
jgi:hypothetical protein